MEGKIALEEHFSTQRNNNVWDAKGEEGRNGVAYAQDVEHWLEDTRHRDVRYGRLGIRYALDSK